MQPNRRWRRIGDGEFGGWQAAPARCFNGGRVFDQSLAGIGAGIGIDEPNREERPAAPAPPAHFAAQGVPA